MTHLSDSEQDEIKALADLISAFINHSSEDATIMLGKALCNDHRTLIQKKGRMFRGFINQLRDDHKKGFFDLRNQALCEWASKVEIPCLPFI